MDTGLLRILRGKLGQPVNHFSGGTLTPGDSGPSGYIGAGPEKAEIVVVVADGRVDSQAQTSYWLQEYFHVAQSLFFPVLARELHEPGHGILDLKSAGYPVPVK